MATLAGRPLFTIGEHVYAWEDVIAGFVAPQAGGPIRPVPERVAAYATLKQRYEEFERNEIVG